MAGIKVNSTAIRSKAGTFKTIASSVKTYTDDMLTEVRNMGPHWTGDAANATIKEFES